MWVVTFSIKTGEAFFQVIVCIWYLFLFSIVLSLSQAPVVLAGRILDLLDLWLECGSALFDLLELVWSWGNEALWLFRIFGLVPSSWSMLCYLSSLLTSRWSFSVYDMVLLLDMWSYWWFVKCEAPMLWSMLSFRFKPTGSPNILIRGCSFRSIAFGLRIVDRQRLLCWLLELKIRLLMLHLDEDCSLEALARSSLSELVVEFLSHLK